MSQATRRLSLLIATLLWIAVPAVPVLADILVMKDGSRLEIEGEWRDKGRVIEFTLPNGTLGAVRASEVDLEASQRATRIANQPPAEDPADAADAEKPEPIAVWTNKDIPQAAPDVVAGAAAAVDAQAVQVVSWEATPGASGNIVSVIRGTLQNYGNNLVTGLSLSVTITGSRAGGADPSLIREVMLDTPQLRPGETTDFVIELRRGDVAGVGTPEEFQDPFASFEVVFESSAADEDRDADEEGDDDDEDLG